MKLTHNTWILISLAGILGFGIYLYEIHFLPSEKTAEEQRKQIFTFTEEEVKTLTIELPDQTLRFERINQEFNPWRMKEPEDVPASSAAIAFLLDALAEEEKKRNFSVPVQKLSDYGLDKPIAKIHVTLEDGAEHQLNLGQPDLRGKLVYAQTDPANQTGKEVEVILVPINFQYAIERDLAEWKEE